MQGTRQAKKLWTIDRPPTLQHSLNSVVDAPTMAELIKFYHASLFSPTITTLENSFKAGFLVTFPTLITKRLRTYPPNSKATISGHIHAKRGNYKVRSPLLKIAANVTTIQQQRQLPHIIESNEETQLTYLAPRLPPPTHSNIIETYYVPFPYPPAGELPPISPTPLSHPITLPLVTATVTPPSTLSIIAPIITPPLP